MTSLILWYSMVWFWLGRIISGRSSTSKFSEDALISDLHLILNRRSSPLTPYRERRLERKRSPGVCPRESRHRINIDGTPVRSGDIECPDDTRDRHEKVEFRESGPGTLKSSMTSQYQGWWNTFVSRVLDMKILRVGDSPIVDQRQRRSVPSSMGLYHS